MPAFPIPFLRHVLARVVAAGGLLLAGASQAALTVDPGFGVAPYGVSDDGRFLAGNDYATDIAFRRGPDGRLQHLGTLGGSSSRAWAISGDGAVVVGQSGEQAYRWTASDGMQALGLLPGGLISGAYGVSADGRVVVGYSGSAGGERAVRWVDSGPAQDLGSLNGGSASYARDASADGGVVVGNANDGAAGGDVRGFRWTAAGGMQSLGTLGGDYSAARAVSNDGSVVVGDSTDATGQALAYRWTAAGGMQSLGLLRGGGFSYANAVSADGQVVVGLADDGAAGGQRRAFRWDARGGLRTVEDWLRDNGVAVAADITMEATGANHDGSVVVGHTQREETFIARVPRPDPDPGSDSGSDPGPGEQPGGGLITVDELARSLYGSGVISRQALSGGNLVLHGAHGNPLLRRVGEGRQCLWATGDWGTDNHGRRDGQADLLEVGGCLVLAPSWQLNLAYGKSWSSHALEHDGRSRVDGDYLLAEVLGEVAPSLWLSVGGYYDWADAEVARAYENAGHIDQSRGDTDIRTWGLRTRLDWENAWRGGAFGLTPYAELSHLHSRIDGYRERGGGFPVDFDGRKEQATELRLGGRLGYDLAAATRLTGSLEAVHRFEDEGPRTSGRVIGLFDFDLPGQSLSRDWLQASLGIEQRLGSGRLSASLNGTTHGQEADAWVSATYLLEF